MRTVVLGAAAAVLLTCGTVLAGVALREPAGGAVAAAPVAPARAAVVGTTRARPAPRRAGLLRVPRAGVEAPLVAVSATDGVLVPPPDPRVLGWWDGGARPGSSAGAVVVTGHARAGAEYALRELRSLHAGDRATLVVGRERHHYRVVDVDVVDNEALTRARAVSTSPTVGSSCPARSATVHATRWTRTAPRLLSRRAARVCWSGASASAVSGQRSCRAAPGTVALSRQPWPT